MSGIRQHHIPRSLLGGFEAQRSGKYPQAYVYRKGRDPYLCTVNDIAVQKNFYSEEDPEQETLDDKITSYERRFSRLLSDLRGLSDGDSVPGEVASEVVVHLTVRGAFLRDFFEGAFREMAVGMREVASSAEAMRSTFQLDSVSLNPMLLEEIEKALKNVGGNVPKDLSRKLAIFSMRENFDSFYEMQGPQILHVLESLVEKTQELARNGHIKALGQGLVPGVRLESLSEFCWRVETFPEKSLVLPDCIAVGIDRKGVPQSYLLSSADEMDQILLALSANKLLVGTRPGASAQLVEDFNSVAAGCSGEFFVAPQSSEVLRSLAQIIGRNASQQVTEIVAGALADLSGKGALRKSEAGNAEERLSIDAPNYPIRFLECAEQSEANEISVAFNTIVVELAKLGSLELMCEVIFASNYQAAFRDLERGFNFGPNPGIAGGDAIVPFVIRKGRVRAVVLLKGEVGRALLTQDASSRSAAIYVVVSALFRVAHFGQFNQKFPGVLLKPPKDPWNDRLLDFANEAFCSYLTARKASTLSPQLKDIHRKASIEVIEEAKEKILEARRMAKETRNVDALALTTLPWISLLLVQLSTYIGFCDGLRQKADDTRGSLSDALKLLGLVNWFEIYWRDVAALFDQKANWQADHLVAFSTHIERILWQFGIFVWKTDDGQTRLDGPSDWEAMQVETFNFGLPVS